MTPDPHWCPVEGCGFGVGEERSLASVRSHINAESREGHDWTELREEVRNQEQGEGGEEQGEAGETTASEQAESSPESPATTPAIAASEDKDGESAEEQTEAGESSPSEQDENAAEMATQQEYEQQHQQQQAESSDERSPEGDATGDPSGDSATELATSDGWPLPSLDSSTVVMFLGVVALLVVLYVVFRNDGDDVEDVDTGVPAEDDEDEMSASDLETGLIQE